MGVVATPDAPRPVRRPHRPLAADRLDRCATFPDQWSPKRARARSATSAGRSSGTKCPQSGTISTARSSASRSAPSSRNGRMAGSPAPTMIRVGVARRPPGVRPTSRGGRCGRGGTLARARSRLGQHRGERPHVVGRPRARGARRSRLIKRAVKRSSATQPPAEQRRGEDDLVGEAPDLQQLAGRRPAERARCAQSEERGRRLGRGRSTPGSRSSAPQSWPTRRTRRRPSASRTARTSSAMSPCRSRRAARRTSRSRAGRA